MAIQELIIPIAEAFEAVQLGKTKGFAEVKSGRLRTFTRGNRRFTTPEWLAEYRAALIDDAQRAA